MPTDDGLWLEYFQGIQHVRRKPIEPREHEPIDIAERQSVGRFTPQKVELMPKHQDLSLQCSPRPKQSDQATPEQPAKIPHQANYRPIRRPPVSRFRFAVGTASSLQHGELMAQDKVFQQEVAATAKPRSHQRDPLEGLSWHEARLANNAPTTKFPDG
jgi:hypothetical protein